MARPGRGRQPARGRRLGGLQIGQPISWKACVSPPIQNCLNSPTIAVDQTISLVRACNREHTLGSPVPCEPARLMDRCDTSGSAPNFGQRPKRTARRRSPPFNAGTDHSYSQQATKCSLPKSLKSGSLSRQMSITRGQRVLKLQPFGGLAGLGTSPSRMIRRRCDFDRRIRDGHRRKQRSGIRMERIVV